MCNYTILGKMQPQRRMNNNMSEIEEQKKQESKRRMMEAAAAAASKFPDGLKEAEFNLQLQQQTDADGTVLHFILRKALGDHNHFRKYLRKGNDTERLLLGLDNTVPGTPEVNDADFDNNPLNGYLNNILGKQGKNGSTNQVYKKVKPNEPTERKGKVESKPSPKPAVSKPKPLPKPLDVPQTSKETPKNPNTIDIGDILKKMTQTLPDTLTDIETPGKVPSCETFQFPQPATHMPQVDNIDEKLDVKGGTCQETNIAIKVESSDNAADASNTFKKVGPDKRNPPAVKLGCGQKMKHDRKVTAVTTPSRGDNSLAEKSAKKEKSPKRDRLKPKVNVLKDTIDVDKSDNNDSSDDKKPILNPSSSPIFTQPASTSTTDTMPTLIKSTTYAGSIMLDQIPQLTDSVCTVPTLNAYPIDDKCFFDDNGTSSIYSMTSFGTTLSPVKSPEYQEPPILLKEEEMSSSYDISASDIIAAELATSGLPPANTRSELVNVSSLSDSLTDSIITSQESSLVSDIFTSEPCINDITSYSINDIFPSSLDLDDTPSLLLPEINNESSLLDPLQNCKPDITELHEELWVNDDPYSVNDIQNIVPKLPVHHEVPCNSDILNSKSTSNVKCFDPITNFSDLNPSKLTIKIPLNGIKLKSNKYRNRTSNNICKESSSSQPDSFKINKEDDCSIIKRKRKKYQKDDVKCISGSSSRNNSNKDVHKKTDCGFAIPSKELIIRISLAKLKRTPIKGGSFSGKGQAKISKLNPEHPPEDVTNMDIVMEEDMVVEVEKSPVPNFMPDLLPLTPPVLTSEERKTEDSHKNDVSQDEEPSCSYKENKKKRGRPAKEKLNKCEVKHRQSKHEMADSKNCDAADDVCHECGTLRKDYGRDSGRINSYKNTYIVYYTEARGCKHRADNLKTPIERAHKYTEAVLKYVQYLIGLELSGKMSIMQGVDEYMQITSECIQLVDYVVTHYGRKENPANQSYDVRFTLLCLRLQSILYLKLFKVKKESAMKYSKVLSKYFKNFKAAGHTGPSLYPKPVHNRGSTGTSSPSSPSPGPSPGGSVASIGSAGSSSGSTGSNDITANGIGQYVTIPTDVHEKAFQHLQYSKNLLHGHLLWEDSESLLSHCQPFLIKLSKKAGNLTMQSSMLHVVDYVTAGLELIKESPHS